MGKLLALLKAESIRRGLVQPSRAVDAKAAFALVRDMPYQRARNQALESVVQEWRGTCSGKHYLLDEIFREEGLESKVIMSTHRFTEESIANSPPELQEVVTRGPVPDVHTYIRLNIDAGWMTVDATWPTKAAPLGMAVNSDFQPGNDTALACNLIETYEVPDGRDPQGFKEELIENFCGSQTDDRDRFINGMGEWLNKYTS